MGSRRRRSFRHSTRHLCTIQHATLCDIQQIEAVCTSGNLVFCMYKFLMSKQLCSDHLLLQALAGTIDKEELADLRDQFDAIDVDKNGSISLEEMRQVGLALMIL